MCFPVGPKTSDRGGMAWMFLPKLHCQGDNLCIYIYIYYIIYIYTITCVYMSYDNIYIYIIVYIVYMYTLNLHICHMCFLDVKLDEGSKMGNGVLIFNLSKRCDVEETAGPDAASTASLPPIGKEKEASFLRSWRVDMQPPWCKRLGWNKWYTINCHIGLGSGYV